MDHPKSQSYPVDKARLLLEHFHEEVERLAKEHDIHGYQVTSCVSVDVDSDGNPVDSILGRSELSGCWMHTLAFLARNIINGLKPEQLLVFLETFNEATKGKAIAYLNPDIAKPEPTKYEVDLINMPLPDGKKWQN